MMLHLELLSTAFGCHISPPASHMVAADGIWDILPTIACCIGRLHSGSGQNHLPAVRACWASSAVMHDLDSPLQRAGSLPVPQAGSGVDCRMCTSPDSSLNSAKERRLAGRILKLCRLAGGQEGASAGQRERRADGARHGLLCAADHQHVPWRLRLSPHAAHGAPPLHSSSSSASREVPTHHESPCVQLCPSVYFRCVNTGHPGSKTRLCMSGNAMALLRPDVWLLCMQQSLADATVESGNMSAGTKYMQQNTRLVVLTLEVNQFPYMCLYIF